MLNTGRQKDGWGKTDHGNNSYKSELTEKYMDWLNVFGIIIIAIIMIPNIIFAVRCKDGFENKWSNKVVETAEQIGRF